MSPLAVKKKKNPNKNTRTPPFKQSNFIYVCILPFVLQIFVA